MAESETCIQADLTSRPLTESSLSPGCIKPHACAEAPEIIESTSQISRPVWASTSPMPASPPHCKMAGEWPLGDSAAPRASAGLPGILPLMGDGENVHLLQAQTPRKGSSVRQQRENRKQRERTAEEAERSREHWQLTF
jgi:hypothetical protein